MRCNCSICKRKGYIIGVIGPDDFKITKGENLLKLYQFHSKTAKHYFAPFVVFIHIIDQELILKIYGINIACIEGVKPFDLKIFLLTMGKTILMIKSDYLKFLKKEAVGKPIVDKLGKLKNILSTSIVLDLFGV